MGRVTDEERRNVARRLRGLEVFQLDGDFIDCGEVEGALGLVSDDGAWYRADGVMRLADLIEPAPSCEFWDAEEQECYNIHTARPVDRDALLAQVGELEKCAWYFGLDFDEDESLADRLKEASEDFAGIARSIREALGVEHG